MERANSRFSTGLFAVSCWKHTWRILDVSVRKAGGEIDEDEQLTECFSSSDSYEEDYGGMGLG